MLGFDPIHVANEGRFIAFVPEGHCELALKLLRDIAPSNGAVEIGCVVEDQSSSVFLKGLLGNVRPIEMLSGEQLPRIC